MADNEIIVTLKKAAQWGQTELLVSFLSGPYREAAISSAKAIKDAIIETECLDTMLVSEIPEVDTTSS